MVSFPAGFPVDFFLSFLAAGAVGILNTGGDTSSAAVTGLSATSASGGEGGVVSGVGTVGAAERVDAEAACSGGGAWTAM